MKSGKRYVQRLSNVSGIGCNVVPSVPDRGAELLSQSESATPEQFCTRGVQNEAGVCPKWLFGRVMLCHNRYRKKVAMERNPPRGSKHTMQDRCPK